MKVLSSNLQIFSYKIQIKENVEKSLRADGGPTKFYRASGKSPSDSVFSHILPLLQLPVQLPAVPPNSPASNPNGGLA